MQLFKPTSAAIVIPTIASLFFAGCSTGPCTTTAKLRQAAIKAGAAPEPASPDLWKKICGTYSGMNTTTTRSDIAELNGTSYTASKYTISGTPEQPIVEWTYDSFDPRGAKYGLLHSGGVITNNGAASKYPLLATSHANGILAISQQGHPSYFRFEGDRMCDLGNYHYVIGKTKTAVSGGVTTINNKFLGTGSMSSIDLKRGTAGYAAAEAEIQRQLSAYNSSMAASQVAANQASAGQGSGADALLNTLAFTGGMFGGMRMAGAGASSAAQTSLQFLNAGLRAQAGLAPYDYNAVQQERQQRENNTAELRRLTAAAQAKPKDPSIRQKLVAQRDKVKATQTSFQPSASPHQAKADDTAEKQLKAKEAAAQAKADAVLARIQGEQVR